MKTRLLEGHLGYPHAYPHSGDTHRFHIALYYQGFRRDLVGRLHPRLQ